MNIALYATIWSALALFVAGEWGKRAPGALAPAGRVAGVPLVAVLLWAWRPARGSREGA